MDEILIEEKKYISSKRAAKVTGYAKDYIGQLCREGRVPARLVGRNWYVLETAIQDHRFGQQDIAPGHAIEVEPVMQASQTTWESPRYEASPTEVLPPLHTPTDEQGDVPQRLQDSWKEWFDRVADTVSVIPDVIQEKPVEKEEETEVHIPIRAIHHSQYQPPPEELLPRHPTKTMHINKPVEETPIQRSDRIGAKAVITIQIAGASFAVLVAALAIIGSGHFDKYILSSNQASLISGVVLYNR